MSTDKLAHALRDAITSLETINRLAGKEFYVGDDGEKIPTYMGDHYSVRAFALGRAAVARAALAAQAEQQAAHDNAILERGIQIGKRQEREIAQAKQAEQQEPVGELQISEAHGPEFKPLMHEDGETYCARCLTRSPFLGSVKCKPHIVYTNPQPSPEQERDKVDAERYRWLKQSVCVDASYSEGVFLGVEVKTDVDYRKYTFHGAELPSFDAAIDAARKA